LILYSIAIDIINITEARANPIEFARHSAPPALPSHTLTLLEDPEPVVQSASEGSKRLYSITPAGVAELIHEAARKIERL
jgi:hypothetical protein